MAVHKLMIDDFVTVDYTLIAIHSSLEDYRLAYFVNRELKIRLQKCPTGISLRQKKESTAYFSRYIFEDDDNDAAWNLIQNKNSLVSTQITNISLFTEAGLSVTTSALFIPEMKTVDYILKVENAEAGDNVISKLLDIKYIATAYKIDHYKLKSKNNLIF